MLFGAQVMITLKKLISRKKSSAFESKCGKMTTAGNKICLQKKFHMLRGKGYRFLMTSSKEGASQKV